ncbi:MAG: HlyC/CorC family transporter [Prolixibacteraceae bacterium]|nr:HlyC/CorC family transporter [Prolixibacteraceae bacterium]
MNLVVITLISAFLLVFFSGMEVAFVSSNKLRLEIDKKQNFIFSGLISVYTQNSGRFVGTMIVGSYLSMITLCTAFAFLIHPFLALQFNPEWLVIFFQILFSAALVLLTGEFLPRILFRINPNGLLKFFSIPIAFFYFLFFPVTKLMTGLSGIILRIFMNEPIKNLNERIIPGRIDLDHFVNDQDNHSTTTSTHTVDSEVKLFRNALDFSKVRLREIMVPRTEMVVLDIDSTVEELHQKFIETGYSRILFYDENIDNIVGYIHHSVIFTKPDSIKSNLRKVLIVPETMSASKLLSQFIQQRLSIAIVVDEFGGTSGMVTSEDILEEIFGEIEDEHDTVDLIKKQVAPDEYVFSGRLELDELNETFNLDFPENENFETLAGFILYNYESIPKINTIITISQYRFKVLKATNTKIELVHLKILDEN